MIHQPAYVRSLLGKYMDGTATANEIAMLKTAWKLYTENEIVEMMSLNLQSPNIKLSDAQLQAALPAAQQLIERSSANHKSDHLFHRFALGLGCLIIMVIGPILINYLFDRTTTIRQCAEADGFIETRRYRCVLSTGADNTVMIASSVSGLISQIDGLQIVQTSPGIVEIQNNRTYTDPTKGLDSIVTISTGALQQYLVKLPDGTMVRLNASSSISIKGTLPADPLQISLSGQAYVQMKGNGMLTIQTYNAQLRSAASEFAITSIPDYTNTVLAKGQLQVTSNKNKQAIQLKEPGENSIITVNNMLPVNDRDTMVLLHHQDIDQALAWTRTQRTYRMVSLRKFVTDMARWYGLKFSSLNCIPKNLVIRTSICYEAPVEEALALIEKAGVKVYRQGEMITFCDPGNSNKAGSGKPLKSLAER